MTLDEYFALDEGFALIVMPFGEGSAKIRYEEFAPNFDIYTRVANDLADYFSIMDPLPTSKSEATARAIYMVRSFGFFSSHQSAGAAAVGLGLMLRDLCGGGPIEDDVMVFLAGHLVAARQAAIQRGYAGASETVQ
jgi:hypothetical protein